MTVSYTHLTDKSGIEEFALFGVDSRSDQLDKGTRSDSIMVVLSLIHIFYENQFAKLLEFAKRVGRADRLYRK